MTKLFSLLFLISLVLSSCSNSNLVSSNRLIQKRKYNKGFHFKSRASQNKQKTQQASEIKEKRSINYASEPNDEIAFKEKLSDSNTASKIINKNISPQAIQFDQVYPNESVQSVRNQREINSLHLTEKKRNEEPGNKPKWLRFRNASLISLGISIGFIVGSFIFSSWLYFAIILTFGAGLIALLISLIFGIIAINEKAKLPKVEKIKRERKQPLWKLFGWLALGFLLLGVMFFIIGLAPMSGIASPLGTLSVLIAIILGVITLVKGISHKKKRLKK